MNLSTLLPLIFDFFNATLVLRWVGTFIVGVVNQQLYKNQNGLLRFAPGIVVISGTELLTDKFLMKYYLSEENSLPKPPTTIEIEEPFETSPVSFVCCLFKKIKS